MSRHRHPVWKTLLVMAADLITIGGALVFAYWFRFYSGLIAHKGFESFKAGDYLWLLPWSWGIWFVSLRFENLYRRRSKILDFNVVRRIVTGSILALLILFALVFYYRRVTDFSRVLIPVAFSSVVFFLVLERFCLSRLYSNLAIKKHFGLSRTLILGGGRLALRMYDRLKHHPEHGMAPIGIVTGDGGDPAGAQAVGAPVLGSIGELESILQQHRIEEVILAQPELDRQCIPMIFLACEQHMATFRIIPDTTELLFSAMTVETLDGVPMLGARETPLQGWNAALKRMIDFGASLAGLILIAPLFGFLAWFIRHDDGGPVFYVQERMGLDGRRFKIFKFRTMRSDAEKRSGPIFADENDNRCTRLGLTLRRYRLDELPQLINVLLGDMSLVGPRPERPYFIEQFRGDLPHYMSRHNVKSGITGWAQINGLCGKRGTIAERLEYDLYYIENWSLWLDVKILFKTLFRAASVG